MNPLHGSYAFKIDCCNSQIESSKKTIMWAKGMLLMGLTSYARGVIEGELEAAQAILSHNEIERDGWIKKHYDDLAKMEETG